MKHYVVVSPQFTTDYGSYEPPEYGASVCSVLAETKADAKVLAVKHKDMKDWVNYQREDNGNPFSGLMVNELICPHGVCYCSLCNAVDECEECLIEGELSE